MVPFVRVFTDLYPVAQIENVNLVATINGKPGLEVKLRGSDETFQYTEDFASVAYDVLMEFVPSYLIRFGDTLLPSTVINIGNAPLVFGDIEWANLAADFNGVPGVEVRVSTDGLDQNKRQITRQYTGEAATDVWNLLSQLAPETKRDSDAPETNVVTNNTTLYANQ